MLSRTQSFLIALLLAFVLTTPFVVHAQGFLDGIVPCGGTKLVSDQWGYNPDLLCTTQCTVCHLVELARNIINFFIFLGVVLATLLFVNAGVLYVTSSTNPGNVAKAHRIFLNTLVGLIVVLAAWLIVDVVMSTLYNKQFGAWNEILCDSPEDLPQCVPAGPSPFKEESPVSNTSGSDGDAYATEANNFLSNTGMVTDERAFHYDHADAMDALNLCGEGAAAGCVTVTSTTGESGVHDICSTGSGCTTLDNIHREVTRSVNVLAENCANNSSTPTCTLQITGGTEPGHAGGTYSHGSGYKVDIDDTPEFDAYMKGFIHSLQPCREEFCGPNNLIERNVSTSYGARTSYFDERGNYVQVLREDDHYDLKVIPKSHIVRVVVDDKQCTKSGCTEVK